MKRYERLASQIGALIERGDLPPGTRIPAIRAACDAYGVSPSTVFRAYYMLERQGLIVARPRSGYFVSAAAPGVPLHGAASTPDEPSKSVNISELVFEVLHSTRDMHTVALGSAFMSPAVFPMQRLGKSCALVNRSTDLAKMVAALPPGDDALRRQIALRYLMTGMVVHVDEIIITSGALDALTLSLQVLTRAGDEIVIEKPTFYAALQAIERLQLKVVEIPVHPVEGHDMEALAQALDHHPIRACWFMTAFQNPTGATLSDTKKQALVALLAKYEVPLIEDDVYSELRFGPLPNRPAKFFDRRGLVLHCGSFAKSLAPGYRIGWAAAGRFAERLERAKWMTTLSASVPAQRAIADYLEHGGYDRFLRKLRRDLAAQQAAMLSAINRYFPAQSTATHPDGGYFTWVELPRQVDSLRLFEAALERGISVAPGPMFSASGEFRHHIRLNYGYPWSPEIERAMATLGELAQDEALVSASLAGPAQPF
ncbi:aminotransferase-like domain-containing protein [Caballeronia sordidicola]|jgi:DNA-binding transcriptional MocR family regulator|uniref:Transcriptional regulator, GntR family domain / Aspartate aminotransferase n=1 Tax=Caballeronia sordidicola TaxID=196367 RepID=A0A226X0G6_CABSO|nr:PLP-dependent aminotransferase family protein [Caballeronia sordidicola]OXC76517.1 Transcriptional regulator, GntR family domain / Aspartate aminotransferase [Caballeronia sordidicola]